MPIGEFGGAPPLVAEGSPALTTPMYWMYEMAQASLNPARAMVEAFLPTHDVYITDWSDARMVPLTEGRFDLDDYVDYIIEMLHVLGGNMHVVAVCQPSVPVVAAVSIMEAER